MNRKTISTAVASLLLSWGIGAHAATLDTTSAASNDGILQNFVGIDWHENGAGWVQGFDLTSANKTGDTDTITFTYQAFAGVINTTTATPSLFVASPGPAVGGYELTTYATLTETAKCLNNGCTIIELTVNGGNWSIYFDKTPNANQAAGTGFTDGVLMLSGQWTSGAGTFGNFGTFGSGGSYLYGSVDYTNGAYVSPALSGTELQASLQFPGTTSYSRPALFNGVAPGSDTETSFVLQTDTSQTFTQRVPEPATLGLLGLALAGMGFSRRRKV